MVLVFKVFQVKHATHNPSLNQIVEKTQSSLSTPRIPVVALSEDETWEAHALRLNLTVPSGIKPKTYVLEKQKEVIDFFRTIEECNKYINTLPPGLDFLEQADQLRHWLANSPVIQGITSLELVEKGLKFIPSEIKFFKNLRLLNIERNEICALPPDIGSLRNLETLNISRTGITTFPAEIVNLTNLTSLSIQQNGLDVLPEETYKLIHLQTLDIEHNGFTTLPADIEKLVNLRKFNVSHNELTALPSELFNLGNLRELDVSYNSLKIGRASCRERVFTHRCRSRWSPYHSSRRRHTRL